MSMKIYARYFKRLLDMILSLFFLCILSSLLLTLTVSGAIFMKGNPFFIQERPGKHEKVFPLIKFRTMTLSRDRLGKLLPDEERLTKYGRFLRKTSLDELPELFNVLKGDMSLVGPRPLLVQYLPLYNEQQRRRHDVRPGLTGLAQVKGRNAISFEERFMLDLEYIEKISLKTDVQIVLKTVGIILSGYGVSSKTSETMEYFTGTPNDLDVPFPS